MTLNRLLTLAGVSFNRTNVELKSRERKNNHLPSGSFNRTNVELKYDEARHPAG